MTDLPIENIPRYYTAMADWLACMLYLVYLPRRIAGWRRYSVEILFLPIMAGFMIATKDLPIAWFLPCIAVSILIMYIFIRMCAGVARSCAAYYCVRAFILGEFAASLEWQLFYYAESRVARATFGLRLGLLIGTFAIVYASAALIERNYSDRCNPLRIHRRELLSTCLIGGTVYAASNLSYVSANTPFSGTVTAEIFNIRTLFDLGGVAILYAHHMQLVDYRRKTERDAMMNVLQAQYQQFRASQDSVELINRKYHDLKHQIAILRRESNAEKNRYLDEIEEGIRSYEAQNKTGNEVLDTLLTSKGLYCQRHRITLTCVADGEALGFIDTMDLCSIFGNALDNAIESTEKVLQSDQRLIHLVVTRQKGFVWIRIENTYDGVWKSDGSLPGTTKGDRQYHGYGLKSIYETTEKYNGTAEIETHDEWFSLKILLPVPI